jgi:sugar phosphate isomerase/epimerase
MFRNFCPGCVGIRADFETNLDFATRFGFEGMDPVGDFATPGAATAMRERYQRAGLRPGGWGLPVEFRKDDAAFREGMKELPRVAAAARDLGCFRCSTWVPSWSDDLTYREQYVLWRDRFSAIADVLGGFECRLGLEFLGPRTLREAHRHEFIHTLPQMTEMVRDVGPNAGLLLDSWHWYTAGGTLDEVGALTDADIVYVHVNDAPPGIPIDEHIDSKRALPGETGVIDIVGFLQALYDVGYTGPVTPEPFSERVNAMAAENAARETGESLVRVWREAGL